MYVFWPVRVLPGVSEDAGEVGSGGHVSGVCVEEAPAFFWSPASGPCSLHTGHPVCFSAPSTASLSQVPLPPRGKYPFFLVLKAPLT